MVSQLYFHGTTLQKINAHHISYYSKDTTEKVSDFSCITISGEKIETKNIKNKIIVLNFWFIACAPCREELKSLTKLANNYKKDTNIVFLSVSSMDGKEQLEFVKKRTGFSYQLVASRSDICSMFHVNLYPTNLILYNNKILFKATGYDPNIEEKLVAIINEYKQ